MGWPGGTARLVLAAAVAAGCTREAEAFPPAPEVVAVSMDEYRFDFVPPERSGRLVFEVVNAGRLEHELVVIQVPAELPPIDVQLRSGDRKVVPTVARMAPRGPGARGTFALDLEPERYALVCFVKDEDGGQHAQKGMSAEFALP